MQDPWGPRTSTHQGPTAGMGDRATWREGSWDEAPESLAGVLCPCPLGNRPWHCCVHISLGFSFAVSLRAFGLSPLLGCWVGRGVGSHGDEPIGHMAESTRVCAIEVVRCDIAEGVKLLSRAAIAF